MNEERTYEAKLRIPTSDQYAFWELSLSGTIKELYEAYNAATAMVKVGEGLETTEWNKALDKYRAGKGMSPDVHEKMSRLQQWMIHELDKSDNRMN